MILLGEYDKGVDEGRWYCSGDDLIFYAKENRWSDEAGATASVMEEKIAPKEVPTKIPTPFDVWYPIFFGIFTFIVTVVVIAIFKSLYLTIYPPPSSTPFGYCNFGDSDCQNYYMNYGIWYLLWRLFSSVCMWVADGIFLNSSWKKFNTIDHWTYFVLLLPLAFLFHVNDLNKLRQQHPTQDTTTADKAIDVAVPVTSTETESVVTGKATKFCRYCGAKMPRNSKFCEECGSQLVT
jgi:hypothetical protein